MFSALAATCKGFAARCVEGIEKLCTIGTGYVDDVTLFVTVESEQPQTERQVKKQLKNMATQWERLLYLTGGKLELTKCFWIPITWKWKGGEPRLHTPKGRGEKLTLVESESKQKVVIPRIKHNHAEKRLGVRYAIDGNWKSEYQFWKQFSQDFAKRIQQARLDRIAGEHAYKTLWCSKFRYCAPVVSFTHKQLHTIQQKIIGPSLTAAGYNSKMPRAVVFGPATLGGMQWESPYSITLYTQLQLLIGSLRLQDTVGKLLIIQLSWLQILAGIRQPLLETTQAVSYIPKGWIQSLHEKLTHNKVQIKIEGLWTPGPSREEDQVIMDYVRDKLPEEMWMSINQCRLFLQAVTFADITTFDGSTIPKQIYKVQKPYRRSRLHFPRQKRPPKVSIQHWQYFIQYIADQKSRLHVPLGKWIKTPYQQYPYSINDTNTLMYQKTGNTWKVYYKDNNTRNRYYDAGLNQQSLPNSWTPVNVIKRQTGTYQVLLPERPDRTAENIGGLDEGMDDTTKSIVGKFVVNDSELQLLRAQWYSQQIVLECGSDGGLKGTIGSSGYVIYRDNGQTPLIKGYSAELQLAGTGSSTRQELLAQLCVEYWVTQLLEKLGEPRSPLLINLITDSQSSIQIREGIGTSSAMKSLLTPDIDVAMEIDRCRKVNKASNITFHKVNSHIAEIEAPNETFWRINNEADALATEAREAVEARQFIAEKPKFLKGAKAMCKVRGDCCTVNMQELIHRGVYEDTMTEYLCNRHNWTKRIFQSVDWETHKKALAYYQGVQKVTAIKYIHGWLSTKKRKYREGAHASPQCELCEEIEDSQHLFCCQNEGLREARKAEFGALKIQLRKATNPEVSSALVAGLGSIGGDGAQIYAQEFITNRLVDSAFTAQQEIGWDNFARGRIALAWQGIGSNHDGHTEDTQWAEKVTKLVMDYGMKLWTHRNTLVHGNDAGISKMEIRKARQIIILLYEELLPDLRVEHRWLFTRSQELRLEDPYRLQVAWIECVKKILPDECRELLGTIRADVFKKRTAEYHQY